jgi:hypothetical protein
LKYVILKYDFESARESMNRFSLAFFLLTASLVWGQSQPQSASASAHVTYEQRWPAADPQWFALDFQSDGSAQYHSLAQQDSNSLSTDSTPDTDEFSFTLTPRSRQLVFTVASSLPRFQSSLDKTKVAFTGKKTLCYEDGAGHSSSISYNYSSSADIVALTELMQGISEAIQFSETLKSQLRFDKLALDSTLNRIDDLISLRPLPEPQILEPILTRIADDPAVMNIARQRARHILQAEMQAGAAPKLK